MIASVKEILTKAKNESYAVGAFNIFNLETVRAVVLAAKEMRAPIIVQITEKTMDYAGGRAIFNLVKNMAEFYAPKIPVGIHLDHGKSFEVIQRAIEIGFTSVMYDGSRKNYNDNLAMTKKISDFCHEKGANIQAELGNVPYLGEIEMGGVDWEKYMTDPGQAEEFVKETGVDALAVAIGNAHDFFKERKEPDLDRLEMINKATGIPLIIHGASDWENGKVGEVIKRGVCCFNIDTSLRLSFISSLTTSVKNRESASFDPRNILGNAREAVESVVREKIKIFGSDGKA